MGEGRRRRKAERDKMRGLDCVRDNKCECAYERERERRKMRRLKEGRKKTGRRRGRVKWVHLRSVKQSGLRIEPGSGPA